MPITFRCPHCRDKISVSRKQAGEQLDCPSCAELVDIPTLKPKTSNQSEPKDVSISESYEGEQIDFDEIFLDESESVEIEDPVPVAEEPVYYETDESEDEEEEFALRKVNSDFDELDLTPMVDVTFLLLIFFMISASFSLQKTMQFPPPEPNEDGATHSMQQMEDLEKESIQIEVTEDNIILVDDVPVDDPALLAEVIADKATANKQQEILLTAHEQAMHDTVVWVFDSASEANIQAVRIITSSE